MRLVCTLSPRGRLGAPKKHHLDHHPLTLDYRHKMAQVAQKAVLICIASKEDVEKNDAWRV
jgi:hypothetical protein